MVAVLSSYAPKLHESSEFTGMSVHVNTTEAYTLLLPVSEFACAYMLVTNCSHKLCWLHLACGLEVESE